MIDIRDCPLLCLPIMIPKAIGFSSRFVYFFPQKSAWRQQLDEVLTDLHQLTGLFKGTNPGQQVLHLRGSPWGMGKPSKYRDFTGENGDFHPKNWDFTIAHYDSIGLNSLKYSRKLCILSLLDTCPFYILVYHWPSFALLLHWGWPRPLYWPTKQWDKDIYCWLLEKFPAPSLEVETKT